MADSTTPHPAPKGPVPPVPRGPINPVKEKPLS